MNALIARGYFVGRRALLGLTTGGTIERFSDGGSYGEMKDVLYSVRRCILEYLGLEVMSRSSRMRRRGSMPAYGPNTCEAGRHACSRRWAIRPGTRT